MIIVMTDETEFHGLADRIRTMLAGYALACENGLNFFIHHTAGFKLETYLEPNEVNWLIPEHKISRGLNCVKTIWFLNQWPFKLSKRHEYHGYRLYTLWPFIEEKSDYTYKGVFNKLFKISDYLRNLVDSAIEQIGYTKGNFIVFHCRFLNFFEQVEAYGKVTTTPEQREAMLANLHATIESVVTRIGCRQVLLFSDSNTVLNAHHPEYIRVLPGTVGHVYAKAKTDGIADKVFTDLFVMTHAKKIFSIVGENIYGGAFSQTASILGNVPFEKVNIVDVSATNEQE